MSAGRLTEVVSEFTSVVVVIVIAVVVLAVVVVVMSNSRRGEREIITCLLYKTRFGSHYQIADQQVHV